MEEASDNEKENETQLDTISWHLIVFLCLSNTRECLTHSYITFLYLELILLSIVHWNDIGLCQQVNMLQTSIVFFGFYPSKVGLWPNCLEFIFQQFRPKFLENGQNDYIYGRKVSTPLVLPSGHSSNRHQW